MRDDAHRPEPTATRAHVIVRGLVQGVFFRGSMQQEARRLGVRGWVRNVPDGTVEAEIEGPRPAVDALIAWAHQGPRGAQVRDVAVTWATPAGVPEPDFAIRR